MKYKAFIFDLDGTILNTLDDLADSLNHILRQFGYPERSLSEVRSFVGNGLHKLIERAVPEGTTPNEVDAVFAEHVPYYEAHCMEKTRPYDGMVELIQELRERGAKTAVVSNKKDEAVQILVNEMFPECFDVVLGERDGMARKPAPDMVVYTLRELGVSEKEAVYIGDSDVDIATADNSGLDKILVTWGFRDREYLEEKGATTFAAKPADIIKIAE